jgi:hypothetical protein
MRARERIFTAIDHKRDVWAIQHARGVSLIESITGHGAVDIARTMFGPSGGPYKLLRNQDHEIRAAKLMGTKIITRRIQKHAAENPALSIQRPRRT